MLKARILFLAGLVTTGMLSAKTVALWPLEKLSNGKVDGSCVINPANDFTVIADNAVVEDQSVGWNLPPNPDTARHAWRPVNQSAAREVVSGKVNGFLYNNSVGDYLARDRTFTVEGYLKILDLPARDQWSIVMAGFDDNNNSAHRWTLSFRRRSSESYACTWILWANGGGDTVLHAYESEEASYAMTNTWMHVALTHEPTTGGNEIWKLYLDGTLAGALTQASRTGVPGAHRFSLGARGSGNPLSAVFDYWRISDEVLVPSQFLNAGEAGTMEVASPTVAYWPLDVTPSGGVDGRDAVGESPLTGGFNNMASFRSCRAGASEDCAFEGNPPNATVSLPSGNAGCLQGCQSYGCLLQNAVGAKLDMSTSFTVEGWFSPRICERSAKAASETVAYVFGTRHDANKGWVLAYRTKGANTFLFDIYCVDQQNGVVQNNVKLSGSYDVAGWYETWHHVALAYDKAGGPSGFGRWTLFIDGVQTGFADNGRAISPVTETRPFFLGGRTSSANQSFQGRIDCVRVAQTVLAPNQFLCATENATAATDVVALWPINVERGYYLDLRDVSGNNYHFVSRDSRYSVQCVTGVVGEAPVIANPDKSPNFRGDTRTLNGCAQFRNPSDGNQHRSYLLSGSGLVTSAVAAGKDFTLECYYRRCNPTTLGQEVLFAVANEESVGARLFRTSEGIKVWDGMHCNNGQLPDTLIPETSDSDMEADTWYHIAFVHTIEPVNGVSKTMWRVYVNGDLKGSASGNRNNQTDTWRSLLVGGRYFSDNNSVNGCLSSVRLSKGALAPTDFLCATSAESVSVPAKTVGYWPIDALGVGLANLADAESPMTAQGTVSSQTVGARASIPNTSALTNLVTGAARRNQGSYALGMAGALTAESVGFTLSLRDPFTVEGWLKYDASGTAPEQDLVSAGEVDSGVGVRLFIDRTGTTPRLKVKARGVWPSTPFIDTAFADVDLMPFADVWTHVAVVYDPTDRTGSWTLYADGRQLGVKIYNFYYPTSLDYFRSGAFRIGSTTRPLAGEIDMWRLTVGVLSPAELLYAAPKGLTIFIR